MRVLNVTNVCEALVEGVTMLYHDGDKHKSRNGDVLVMDTPVTTVYQKPWERVLFSRYRNANPWFHLMEALWMLGGRNDLAWPMYFNKRFREFSDDDSTVRGSAYGFRWAHWFGHNQLRQVVQELRQNPQSRRVVLGMWDAATDPQAALEGSKDVPCNTHIYLAAHRGVLDMTVCNRSNDIWWGAYGANAVHMSVLQEWVAASAKIPMGRYYQISNNYHLYTDVVTNSIANDLVHEHNSFAANPYKWDRLESRPMFTRQEDISLFPMECNAFCSDPDAAINFTGFMFLQHTAYPMFKAWQDRKEKAGTGIEWAYKIAAPDWRRACIKWITRKEMNKEITQ